VVGRAVCVSEPGDDVARFNAMAADIKRAAFNMEHPTHASVSGIEDERAGAVFRLRCTTL
jgi:hypothetical protein